MIQPEIKALQTKYKGNRTKVNEETMRLYQERGVNPASGCLPSFLQLFLLIPIYSVINTGPGRAGHQLGAAGPRRAGPPGPDLPRAGHAPAVHQPDIAWLGLDAHLPQHSFILPVIGFGVSACWPHRGRVLQLIQTRMAQPTDERSAAGQPAAHLPAAAAVLDLLRLVPAGGPVHLLDRFHGLLDHSAIPDRRLGITLPDLRMDARLRGRTTRRASRPRCPTPKPANNQC